MKTSIILESMAAMMREKTETSINLGGITLNPPPETNMAMEKMPPFEDIIPSEPWGIFNQPCACKSDRLLIPWVFQMNLFPTVANLNLVLLYILGGCLQPTQLEAFWTTLKSHPEFY